MNCKNFSRLVFYLALITFSCSKENKMSSDLTQSNQEAASKKAGEPALKSARGATQISGIGFPTATGDCAPLMNGASFALKMTGDFEGCLYVFVDDYKCSPSGTYREKGREYFVGTYNGKTGTFWTTYRFEAKYEGCAANGAPLGAEIFGRCQHPIVDGSGTGVFEGVTGQVNFKDDIKGGNYPYKGHLQY